jgi:hypothetical protein|tara:strand:+ start:133 stop:504 length:372 start_codon:yes stop_codon:yes gene_type:complete
MADLYWKVKAYLESKGKTESEIGLATKLQSPNVQLVNEGSGDIIKVWKVSGVTKPTDSELNALNTQATKDQNNHAIKKTRMRSYGNIGDQLDLLYKDMLADKGNKTGEWFKKVKAVKDDNPKE